MFFIDGRIPCVIDQVGVYEISEFSRGKTLYDLIHITAQTRLTVRRLEAIDAILFIIYKMLTEK